MKYSVKAEPNGVEMTVEADYFILKEGVILFINLPETQDDMCKTIASYPSKLYSVCTKEQ